MVEQERQTHHGQKSEFLGQRNVMSTTIKDVWLLKAYNMLKLI